MDTSRRRLIHFIARAVVGFVWIYHGAVPKLLYRHPDELALLFQAGVPWESVPAVVQGIGWAEVLLGVLVWLGLPAVRWPLLVTIVFGLVATVGVAIKAPQFLSAAFNPVSLNVLLVALALIGLMTIRRAGNEVRV